MSDNFQIKNPFTIRLTDDDFLFVNDNLSDIIQEIEADTLNNRNVFMKIFNKALSNIQVKKSLPADIEKIKQLEAKLQSNETDIESLDNLNKKLQSDIEEYNSILRELRNENNNLLAENEKLENKFAEMETKYYQEYSKVSSFTRPNLVTIELTEAELAVTNAFREKLETDIKKPVTIGQMLFDLFWKYVTKQDTQIAFPFYLSKNSIKKLIQDNQQ